MLVDALKRMSDQELGLLFTLRPELADPAPASFADLATRASSPYSVHLCLQQLNQADRDMLDALVYLGEPSTADDVAKLPAEQADVDEVVKVLAGLRARGLVEALDVAEGMARTWMVHAGLPRMFPPPFGLRPSLMLLLDRYGMGDLRTMALNLRIRDETTGKLGLVGKLTATLGDPSQLQSLIDSGTPNAQAILHGIHDDLDGAISLDTRPWSRSEIPEDLGWLLSHGLLVPYGSDVVVVAREVALHLRGGHPVRKFSTTPPKVAVLSGRELSTARAGLIELTPPGVCEAIATLCSIWGRESPVPLRGGGVAVKDIRAMTKTLGVDERSCGRLVELAGIAGLLAVDFVADAVSPTPAFDEWLARPARERWLQLVSAWMMVGGNLSRTMSDRVDEKATAPLAEVWYRTPEHVWYRAQVLHALASVGGDEVPDQSSVMRHARWYSPARWGEVHAAEVVCNLVIEEAALLGLVRNRSLTPLARLVLFNDAVRRGGALSSVGSSSSSGSPDAQVVEDAFAAVFPPPATSFTISGDHSVIAPSELDGPIATELALMSEVVSKGHATVYRITEASLRRAFDAGRAAEDLLAFLETHATPAVPQTLTYLVNDVSRRYGSVRIGGATSYVRVEEAALLAELVRHKKLAKLHLRLLAPTVAVSPLPAPKVLVALRDAGFLPVEEGPDGAVVRNTQSRVDRNPLRRRAESHESAEGAAIWAVATGQTSRVPTLLADNIVKRLRSRQ